MVSLTDGILEFDSVMGEFDFVMGVDDPLSTQNGFEGLRGVL